MDGFDFGNPSSSEKESQSDKDSKENLAINLSNIANVFLLILKVPLSGSFYHIKCNWVFYCGINPHAGHLNFSYTLYMLEIVRFAIRYDVDILY